MAAPGARNTTRHREAAAASRAETRRRLLAAAGAEFTEHGYRAATVKRIAERAGVTVQTLYLAWTSKATLLHAHLEHALSGDSDPDADYATTIDAVIARVVGDATGDPAGAIRAFAHLFRTMAERAAPAWKLYRDAAATDPAIAAEWHRLQQLRRDTMSHFVAHLPTDAFRAGVNPEQATTTAWMIASPETFGLMVEIGGSSLDEYEAWIADTLTATLLSDGRHPNP